MATDIYSEGASTYDVHARDAAEASTDRTYRDPAGTAFLWIAWVLAFAVWAFFMTVFFGILDEIARGGPDSIRGGFDAAGGGFLFMDVIGGIIVLGAAIAWGAARWATRDKRNDPLTEAATAELYDSVSRAGGDDKVARSPEARSPEERDSYRPI